MNSVVVVVGWRWRNFSVGKSLGVDYDGSAFIVTINSRFLCIYSAKETKTFYLYIYDGPVAETY